MLVTLVEGDYKRISRLMDPIHANVLDGSIPVK